MYQSLIKRRIIGRVYILEVKQKDGRKGGRNDRMTDKKRLFTSVAYDMAKNSILFYIMEYN